MRQTPNTLLLSETAITVSELVKSRVLRAALNDPSCDAERLAYIESVLLPASIEWCETYIRYSVFNRTWLWQFELEDICLPFYVPREPVSSILSFQSIDAEGARTDISNYDRFGPLLRPSCGDFWPCEACMYFEIVFSTGMASIPMRFIEAVVQLVAFWDEDRSGTSAIPDGVKALLSSMKRRIAV